MIRISRGFLTVLAVAGLLAAGIPLGAQAEIFVRKQGTESQDKPAAKGIFVPYQGSGNSVFDPTRGNNIEQSVGGKYTDKDIKSFDPTKLSSAGGEPRTVQDLMMLAVAHNAVKNNALSEMRANIQKQQGATAKVSQGQSPGTSPTHGNGFVSSSKSKPSAVVSPPQRTGKRIFVQPGANRDAPKKPTGVFKNY